VHAPDGNAGGMHGSVDSDFVGTGFVHITPQAPDNCATANDEGTFNDTDGFEVIGYFTAHLAP
jgi:hypothetical protein